ncbi:MAG: aldo/keto reductase, partial [Planctomycetaceae bacterium]
EHDLRAIFGPGGAIEALTEARDDGRVRFLGLTGHHDPAILVEAMRRFDFDTVLVALNAADVHYLPFIPTVPAEAERRGLGVIGMKVYAAGTLVARGGLAPRDAMSYVLSLPGVSTTIIGCRTPEEVDENAEIARGFSPLDESQRQQLEQRTRAAARAFNSYKRAV